MRRWPISFAEGRRRGGASAGSPGAAVLLAVAGLAVGLAAEHATYSWDEPRWWVPDLATGVLLVGAGAYCVRQRTPGAGLLLAATGFAWFAGTVEASLLYLHRGPLIHALVTYPGWRPRSRFALAAAFAGWVAALSPAWRSEPRALVLGLGVVALAALVGAGSGGVPRADRRVAAWATLALGVTLAGGAAIRLAVPSGRAAEPLLLVYEVVVGGVALGLAAHRRPAAAAGIADRVVELGGTAGTLRDALAVALGDHTLELGYWHDGAFWRTAERDDVLPGAGTRVDVPDPASPGDGDRTGAARAATFVERDGAPFAVLVHDPAVLDDPALVAAAATAVRLAAANAELQDDVRAHVGEVAASRRRLVLAADHERRRLEARLRRGVERRLRDLAGTLDAAAANGGATGEATGHLDKARALLDHTLDDLGALAQGMHPGDLRHGLPAALAALVDRSPVAAELTATEGGDLRGLDGDVAVAAYFVCAEALANVAKHAGAAHATVRVAARGSCVVVTVADDGAGGADPAAGSGLRGLADRVGALGGTLRIDSPPGAGTRLEAELPLDLP